MVTLQRLSYAQVPQLQLTILAPGLVPIPSPSWSQSTSHSGLEWLPGLQCYMVSAEGTILPPTSLWILCLCGLSPRFCHSKLMAATASLSALLRSQPIGVP